MKQAIALAAVAVLFVASCTKQDVEKDQAAVRGLVESDTTHFAASTSHDSADSGSGVKNDTAVLWWRGPQGHDSFPGVTVKVVGDSAWVDWTQHNYGHFYVLASYPTDTLVLWDKRLEETVRLRGIYQRTGKVTDTDRGWQLSKLSLATARSDSTNTVRIDSLKIHSSLRDVTINDPLNTFYGVDNLLTFTPGELVTLTLYTNATAGAAFLHTFVLLWPFYVRVDFTDMGAGVFQGTWHTQLLPGFKFGIFDLLTRTTIHTPDKPYDFNGWLLPYQVQTAD